MGLRAICDGDIPTLADALKEGDPACMGVSIFDASLAPNGRPNEPIPNVLRDMWEYKIKIYFLKRDNYLGYSS